jgi:hypothetical protein
LATFPGAKADTPEEFLMDWDNVSGTGHQPYLAKNTFEQVKYVIRQAYGTEMEDIQNFGPSRTK